MFHTITIPTNLEVLSKRYRKVDMTERVIHIKSYPTGVLASNFVSTLSFALFCAS